MAQGTVAGRYTPLREVGRGGSGAVWLARDEVLGRQVALKRTGVVPEGRGGGGTGGGVPDQARSEREGRLAASVVHPHVVAVFDLVEDAGEHWLVMEYVEGVTLAGLVDREGPLPADQAAALLAQVADALAAAHAAGVVHRDVKPSNVLVGPDGQVKLTDFGIARRGGDPSLTMTGLVTGSPAYLAPEVASGRPATGASDVWSTGATLFHLLAGRPPYDVGENVLGALYRIVHEDPPRLPPAQSGWLTPLLEATMATDPDHRWSMAQVRDALRAGSAGTALPRPAPARAPEVVAPVTQALPVAAPAAGRSGDRRGLLVGAVAAAVLLVALVAGFVASLGGEDDPADQQAGGPSGDGTSGATASPSPSDEGGTDEGTNEGTDDGATGDDAATEEGMEAFVADYLATVTTDPRASFEQLTPEFQEASGGFGSYSGFWRTIRSASVQSVEADVDAMTVAYRVTYTTSNGSTSTDDVVLRLTFDDGRYLIADEA